MALILVVDDLPLRPWGGEGRPRFSSPEFVSDALERADEIMHVGSDWMLPAKSVLRQQFA